jgi:hypothetical protein
MVRGEVNPKSAQIAFFNCGLNLFIGTGLGSQRGSLSDVLFILDGLVEETFISAEQP